MGAVVKFLPEKKDFSYNRSEHASRQQQAHSLLIFQLALGAVREKNTL